VARLATPEIRDADDLVDAFVTDVTLGVEKAACVSTRLTFI
jgi:hypothetical protein